MEEVDDNGYPTTLAPKTLFEEICSKKEMVLESFAVTQSSLSRCFNMCIESLVVYQQELSFAISNGAGELYRRLLICIAYVFNIEPVFVMIYYQRKKQQTISLPN